jgi:glycosyltransferase involved in cell wall biosynthesis
MLRAAAQEASRRGHQTGFVFSDVARGRAWLTELVPLGEIHFLAASRSRATDAAPIMLGLARLRDGRGPGVLHTHFSTFDIPAALVGLKRRDLALFWHEHTPLAAGRHTRWRNALRYRCVGARADLILCVSPELRRDLRARGAPESKLRDFPNAIDTERFSPITAAERTAARARLGLSDRTRVALHFGWNWHRKGGDLMLAAAEQLEADRDLVVLTVLGEENAGDLASSRERTSGVRALAPTSDIRSLYAAADVFLSCSRAEGMPFAVMEALACGLPVVGSDLPVQRDLLLDLPGGVIVAPEDPGAIAAGITAMLSLEAQAREQHARRARARIEPAFGLRTWAGRLVDLYESASR